MPTSTQGEVENVADLETRMDQLRACPALPRGERLAWVCSRQAHVHFKCKHRANVWFKAYTRQLDWWLRAAAPLRKAREQRKLWEDAWYQDVIELQDAIVARDVGASLLAFFTDLSVIVRQTPAPCPFCGNFTWEDLDTCEIRCATCAIRLGGNISTVDFNRVAIPAAYARLVEPPTAEAVLQRKLPR